MWISQTLARGKQSHASLYPATLSEGTPPVLVPEGISYTPSPGSKTMTLSTPGGFVCAGICQPPTLPPGELRLSSAGGASIHLLASGDIVLNGVTITAAGDILPPRKE